jgi:DNA gyrase subunit B
MRPLIEKGHIWVARPPLFKVEQKKTIRYVQTHEEMTDELSSRGLDGTKLTVAPPEGTQATPLTFEGDPLRSLVLILDELEKSLVILERRGLSVGAVLGEMKNGKLPRFSVLLGSQESWFFEQAEVDAFRQEQQQKGHELVVADTEAGKTNGNGNGTPAEIFYEQELHEIKKIELGLTELRKLGLAPADLLPTPRIAGREPAPRFFLEHEGKQQLLAHLRVLVVEIRKLGERGIKVTRFKGLGEMDGEELWDTTLDPSRRTLLRVQLDDALKADEMFRILMGEKVEPRREFIHKHALEVKEIDLHGA